MNILIKILTILFISTCGCYSQRTDSLLRTLNSADDTSKVLIWNQLSQAYLNKPKSKSKKKETVNKPVEYASKALKLAETIKYKRGIALSHFQLGYLHLKEKNYREAELAFLNSVELAKEIKDHELVLKNFSYIFKFHKELGNTNNAIAYADFKSLYKDVIIEELKSEKEFSLREYNKALSRIRELDSVVKIKMEKEREDAKALAKIPEKVIVTKYQKQKDYKLIGILLILLLVSIFIIYKLILNKNAIKRKLREVMIKSPKIRDEKLELQPKDEKSLKGNTHLEKTRNRFHKDTIKPSSEMLQKDANLKTGQLLHQAHYIVQKNEILLRLIKEFNGLKESKIEELSKKITGINYSISENYNAKKDWEDFLNYFEDVYPDFLYNTKKANDKLNELELKIMAMNKLNLTYYEMASILHISEREIEKACIELERKI